MPKESIQVEREDDVQSIIEKINSANGDVLDLIVPTGAKILQNIVDAHLLKEAVARSAKHLTVVTNDVMARIFAQRVGLSLNDAAWDSTPVIATPALAANKMTDIVPKKRHSFASLAARKAPVNPRLNPSPEKLSKTGSVFKRGREGSKKLSYPARAPAARKGEIGASFLKAYKEERAKNRAFYELAERSKKRMLRPFKLNTTAFVGLIVVVALAAAFVVFGRALPKADILVYPARESMSSNIEVLVSSEAQETDLAKGVVVGEILTSEKTETASLPAGGLKDVSEKAKGRITVYNEFSSQNQTLIPSRFQSPDGKIFWSTKTITIPGASVSDGQARAGQISVDVVAAEAGESYNIKPGRFTLPAFKNTPKGAKIYGISELPMSGGQSGQVTVVSSDDASRAYDALKEKIKPQLQTLRDNLPVGFQLWPEAYNEELADSSTKPEIGGIADSFTAIVKMVARAVVFKAGDLDNYINQEINKGLAEGKMVLASSKDISFLKSPVVDYQKGTIFATLAVKFDVMNKFDEAAFKRDILKKSESDIKKVLANYKDIERVEVKLWPFWVRQVPGNQDRVNVTIKGL